LLKLWVEAAGGGPAGAQPQVADQRWTARACAGGEAALASAAASAGAPSSRRRLPASMPARRWEDEVQARKAGNIMAGSCRVAFGRGTAAQQR
jgi:hypothetical protein